MATKKIVKDKSSKNFSLENTNGMEEIFADGISSLMIGRNVSKVIFHTDSVSDDDTDGKLRKAVLTLIMSTPTLILTCKRILEAAKESKDKLTDNEHMNIEINKLLDSINID